MPCTASETTTSPASDCSWMRWMVHFIHPTAAGQLVLVFVSLVPLTVVVIDWIAMGESLSGLHCVVAAVVDIGVGISQKGARYV